MGCVYFIVNRTNDKVYIGQTIRRLEDRMYSHRTEARNDNRPLYNAVRKHGWNNFAVQKFVETDSSEKLNNLEKLLIILFRSTDINYGYNLAGGGQDGPVSEETRRKLRESHLGQMAWNKGKKMSKAFCRANRLSHLGKPVKSKPPSWQGRAHSAESRVKMSEHAKQRKIPKWVRRKISATLKEKGILPPRYVAPCGELNPNFGGKSSAKAWETRRKKKGG